MIVVIGQPAYRLPSNAAPGAAVGLAVGVAVGPAVGVARAAVEAGAAVQVVGKVGADAAGDALLLDLARAGIGHAAILRDPGRPTPTAQARPDAAPGAGPSPTRSLDPNLDPDVDEDDDGAPVVNEPLEPDARHSLGPGLDPADVELGLRYLTGYGVVVAAEPLDAATLAIVAEAAAYAGSHLVVVTASGTAGPVIDRRIPATLLEAPPDDLDGQFVDLVGRYAAALDTGVSADQAFRAALGDSGWEPATPTT